MSKKPFVILLIGVPLSGKTTFIRKNYPNTKVISRDDLVMEVYGSDDYTSAFKEVDQKEVDRLLDLRLKEVNINKENVIVDMTNMTVIRRAKTLNYFSDNYYRAAIIFKVLEMEEYERRNNERNIKENKWIPLFVIENMLNSSQNQDLKSRLDKAGL